MSTHEPDAGPRSKNSPTWEQRLDEVEFGGLRLSMNALYLQQLATFREELVGKTVLVPGFANFPDAMWLASIGARVVGVDSSSEGCSDYKMHWETRRESVAGVLDICQFDVRDYVRSVKTDAFYAVISELLIHIFSRAEQAHVLEEFQRVIQPGGFLLLTALASGDRNFPTCPDLVAGKDLTDQFPEDQWTVQQCVEYEEGTAHCHSNGERHNFPHRIVLFVARRHA